MANSIIVDNLLLCTANLVLFLTVFIFVADFIIWKLVPNYYKFYFGGKCFPGIRTIIHLEKALWRKKHGKKEKNKKN